MVQYFMQKYTNVVYDRDSCTDIWHIPTLVEKYYANNKGHKMIENMLWRYYKKKLLSCWHKICSKQLRRIHFQFRH